MARPRCATNQRFAIAAAMPTAPALAPTPTITPQVANSCHGAVMNVERPVPTSRSDRHDSTVRRSPSVSIRPVMNGPVMPSSRMLSEIAAEIVPTLQPNACSSGTMITPGAARTPTAPSVMVKATVSATHA